MDHVVRQAHHEWFDRLLRQAQYESINKDQNEKPMIKKIVIRDVASYDHEGVTFDNLSKVNFIYGGNGRLL